MQYDATRKPPSSVYRSKPSFHLADQIDFELNDNASSEENYIENVVVVSIDINRARLSPGSKSNSKQQTMKLGKPMERRRATVAREQ
jgi:hypothetical protein